MREIKFVVSFSIYAGPKKFISAMRGKLPIHSGTYHIIGPAYQRLARGFPVHRIRIRQPILQLLWQRGPERSEGGGLS